MKDVKVIIFLATLQMGGAERRAIHIAKYLKYNRNANVKIFSLSQPGEASNVLDQLKIPWEILPFPKISEFGDKMKDLKEFILRLRKHEPQIILTFTFHPNLLFNRIWQYTGAKVCIWNQADAGKGFGFSSTETHEYKLLSLKNKSYAFVSNSLEGKLFLESYHPGKIKVDVIRNGTKLNDPIYSRKQWRKKIGIEDNNFVAVKIANLTKAKDHITILKAWRIVVDKWNFSNKPVLLFAGRFEQTYEELKLLVIELRLQSHVFFLGHVVDISGLLGASDMGVFSSKSEGIPNGILECMYAKLPVISTDLMGVREALGDNEEFLVPIADSLNFANKILNMVSDPLIIKKIGQKNYLRVIEEFTLEKMLLGYSNLIDRCWG